MKQLSPPSAVDNSPMLIMLPCWRAQHSLIQPVKRPYITLYNLIQALYILTLLKLNNREFNSRELLCLLVYFSNCFPRVWQYLDTRLPWFCSLTLAFGANWHLISTEEGQTLGLEIFTQIQSSSRVLTSERIHLFRGEVSSDLDDTWREFFLQVSSSFLYSSGILETTRNP